MRICLWCLGQGAWTHFANEDECFLCKDNPAGREAQSYRFTKAEQAVFQHLRGGTHGKQAEGHRTPSPREIEALEALRQAILKAGPTSKLLIKFHDTERIGKEWVCKDCEMRTREAEEAIYHEYERFVP